MNDEQILAMLAARNEAAVYAMQEKYGAYCLAIANRIVGDPLSAEECLNDALQSAWESIPPAPQNLKLYLAALVRNAALSRVKKETAQKRGGKTYDAVYEELSECIASCEQGPEKIVMSKELSLAVNRFLKTLPERDRSIFLRRYFFLEDTQTIAEKFTVRQSNVLLILSRTRKKLRHFLETEGYLE